MKAKINRYCKDVIYVVGDKVWLSNKYIKITRLCKDLEDK